MTTAAALAAMLDDLAADIVYPATPPLVEAVTDRIVAAPEPGSRRRWPWIAAVAAVALVVTLGLPPTRRAVADLLGIGPVRISQVAELSPAATVRPLGQLTTMGAAADAVSYDLLTVDDVEPDAVFIDGTVPGGMVTLAYGSPTDGWRLLVTQLDGTTTEGLAAKEIGPGTTVEQVTVAGAPGLWIAGEPHTVVMLDADGTPVHDAARLAGDTLLTTRHGVLVRIEADAPLAEAVRVAERLVPFDP